jgi:hypothetical protein
MSDDRKEEGASTPESDDGEGEPGNTLPPFVPYDDTANMIAIHAQRRRAYAAMLASSGGGSSTPIVLEDGSTPIVLEDGSTPIVLEDGSIVREEPPGLGEVALRGEGGFTVAETVLSPWAAVRVEMVAKLDAIEAGLQRIAPVIEAFETAYREHARIGHNNPPEEIDILPIGLAELELGIVAANLARTEINAERPRSDVIRLCGLVLNWTAGLVSACVKWIGAKGDVYVDSFLKALGPLTATALVAKLCGLDVDLNDVVTTIRHVLALAHLPF